MRRAGLTGLLLLAAGCYESPDVTLHEPGEYQGPRDPLLDLQRNPAQQERLSERLRRGQTDR